MLQREVIGRPAARWIGLAALGVGLCTAALLARPARGPAATAPPVVRVAIRVDGHDAAACALAESWADDVWSEERGAGLPLDLVVPSDRLPLLAANGVTWQVLVADIDAVAAEEHARLAQPAVADKGGDWFAEYRDYKAITTHLEELTALAPDLVSMQAIGNSLENRPLWALKFGGGAAGSTKMMIDGTQHAREWIAAMTTTCVADRLIRGYATDPAIKDFVDHTELWVVPVVNPDGYQYSWSTNRYWRKNKRENHGVDLNRNFDLAFGGAGSSGFKAAENYRGPAAFSEPESAAIRDLMLREKFALSIDFHAYSQLLLYPWSYSSKPAKDRDKLAAIGDRMASAMYATHQVSYKLISGVELYPASGSLMDWAYGEAGALAYTIELRPKGPGGRAGFVLPPSEIRPTCDEGLAAVLELRRSATP